MGVNKVVCNGKTLVDLTGTTVTPETLVKGATAFNKKGVKITGTAAKVNCYLEDGTEKTSLAQMTMLNSDTNFYIDIGTENKELGVLTFAAGRSSEQYVEEIYSNGNLTGVNIVGVTAIRAYQFYNCSKLTGITLPTGLTSIGSNSFYKCSGLKNVQFPAEVKTVSAKAFADCTSLQTARFNGTPTSIDSDVFTGCTKLTSIIVPWSEGAVSGAPWGATNATVTYLGQK